MNHDSGIEDLDDVDSTAKTPLLQDLKKPTGSEGAATNAPGKKKFSRKDREQEEHISKETTSDSDDKEEKYPLEKELKDDGSDDLVVDLKFETPSHQFLKLKAPDQFQIWHVLLGEWDSKRQMVFFKGDLEDLHAFFKKNIQKLFDTTASLGITEQRMKEMVELDIKGRISLGLSFGTQSENLLNQYNLAEEKEAFIWEEFIGVNLIAEYTEDLCTEDAYPTIASIELLATMFQLSVLLVIDGEQPQTLNAGYSHVGIHYDYQSGFVQRLADASDLQQKQKNISEVFLERRDDWLGEIKLQEENRVADHKARLDQEEKASCSTRCYRSISYFLNFFYNLLTESKVINQTPINEPPPPRTPFVEGTLEDIETCIVSINDCHAQNRREMEELDRQIEEKRERKNRNMPALCQTLTSKNSLAIGACFICVCTIAIGGAVTYYALHIPPGIEDGDEQPVINRSLISAIADLFQETHLILPLGAAAMAMLVCCCNCGNLFVVVKKVWDLIATRVTQLESLGNRNMRLSLAHDIAFKKLITSSLNLTDETRALRRELESLRGSQTGTEQVEGSTERTYGREGGFSLLTTTHAMSQRSSMFGGINNAGRTVNSSRLQKINDLERKKNQDSKLDLSGESKATKTFSSARHAGKKTDQLISQRQQLMAQQKVNDSKLQYKLRSTTARQPTSSVHSSSVSSSSSLSFLTTMTSSLPSPLSSTGPSSSSSGASGSSSSFSFLSTMNSSSSIPISSLSSSSSSINSGASGSGNPIVTSPFLSMTGSSSS